MKKGYYGNWGGQYISELLMPAILELEKSFEEIKKDSRFLKELNTMLQNYSGRPTPLTYCANMSKELNCEIYLKREDLNHTGAHKINNALGQALLARKLGKTRIIAETGAGQHGVATATACARLGLKCEIYMGEVDCERQAINVHRMELLGATVHRVVSGTRTLKDAINEALRDWSSSVESTHYLLGSVLGPHPFPEMVTYFQSIIGIEARQQMLNIAKKLPDYVVACVGGGSNAMGIFKGFLDDKKVRLIGVEAGGKGIESGKHASRMCDTINSKPGIFQGTKTYVLQENLGQIRNTYSISAGLDYCAIGPEHTHLAETGRAKYDYLNDDWAVKGFKMLSEKEGIIPALESSHAIGYVIKNYKTYQPGEIVLINLSGRGDKDLMSVIKYESRNVS
ncbi:MAG: tryptophan synthase subunit beta [Candidatus Marinimicrobia bacterium]|nr:tryptophan synthase subunit beta [Candidatus Neomarinimicrobiota bacterium]